MTKVRSLVVATLVALLAISIMSVQPAGADTVGDEGSFMAKLNGLRQSKGIAPLNHNGALTDMARAWSANMAAVGTISHNPSLAAQGPSNWARLGENVGIGMDVQGLHEAFVNSPLHYKNMVDGGFDAVGVGVVRRGDGMIFVTVNFMTSKAAPAPAVAAAAPAPPPPPPAPARPAPAPAPVAAPAPAPAPAPVAAPAPAPAAPAPVEVPAAVPVPAPVTTAEPVAATPAQEPKPSTERPMIMVSSNREEVESRALSLSLAIFTLMLGLAVTNRLGARRSTRGPSLANA